MQWELKKVVEVNFTRPGFLNVHRPVDSLSSQVSAQLTVPIQRGTMRATTRADIIENPVPVKPGREDTELTTFHPTNLWT